MARSEIDLLKIAEQMAANRAPKERVRRVGELEHVRRRDRWWRCQAIDWIDHTRAHLPPSDWAFVDKLTAHLQATGKKELTVLAYSDAEKRAWRSFVVWHELVARDLCLLVELLKDHQRWPCDSALQQRLVDRGCEIKERYRSWLESSRILWMPAHWALQRRDGSREAINVVEYAADALLAYETVKYVEQTPAEWETTVRGLRKELNDVREAYFGARP